MTFEEDTESSIQAYEKALKGYASRTREMIARHGCVEALSRLAISPDLQKGFKALRDTGALDSTFEAVILRHQDRFRKDVVEAAKWRIDNPHQLLST